MVFGGVRNAEFAGGQPRRGEPNGWDAWKPAPRPFDWKKALLLVGLGTLSWISTYTGMLELIKANMGEVGLTIEIAIGFAVAMLMLMIVWLLDRLFDRIPFSVRALFLFGYIFLTVISIGFGFGFYWKYLESRSEASRSAEAAVTQVQTSLQGAQARLEQLQSTLASLTTISQKKALAERELGNSCPNSRPGDGPRRRLRDADAARFNFAANFVSTRATAVKQDIANLNTSLAKVVSQDKSTFDAVDGTRNNFLRSLSRQLDMSVSRFNAFRSDPQLQIFRGEFADRSEKTIFPNGAGGTFSCPDVELQTALRGVVKAIDLLPELEKPEVKAVEGSEAIIEAFRRLTTTLQGAVQFELPPSPEELRALRQKAIASLNDNASQRRVLAMEPGLGDRDYIPLFIAIFVDFCLLLVSVSRPMNGFQWLDHRMGEAQEWPVIKILGRFRDIHQDEEIRQVFDVFRHVVFDWRGVYYAAIPLNGTDPTFDRHNQKELAIQAQLLMNLFTSFENEGVFTRTPISFFTNGFIQKKLREQGSKFCEAEAFRIYRFRKDMWQDWMLSAMMGAARRVEATKQKQALEGELFGTADLSLPDGRETSPDVRDAAHPYGPGEDALRNAMDAVELSIDPDRAPEGVSVAAGEPAAGERDDDDTAQDAGTDTDEAAASIAGEPVVRGAMSDDAETITREDLTAAVQVAVAEAVAATIKSMKAEFAEQDGRDAQGSETREPGSKQAGAPFNAPCMAVDGESGSGLGHEADCGQDQGHGIGHGLGQGASVHQLFPGNGPANAPSRADPHVAASASAIGGPAMHYGAAVAYAVDASPVTFDATGMAFEGSAAATQADETNAARTTDALTATGAARPAPGQPSPRLYVANDIAEPTLAFAPVSSSAASTPTATDGRGANAGTPSVFDLPPPPPAASAPVKGFEAPTAPAAPLDGRDEDRTARLRSRLAAHLAPPSDQDAGPGSTLPALEADVAEPVADPVWVNASAIALEAPEPNAPAIDLDADAVDALPGEHENRAARDDIHALTFEPDASLPGTQDIPENGPHVVGAPGQMPSTAVQRPPVAAPLDLHWPTPATDHREPIDAVPELEFPVIDEDAVSADPNEPAIFARNIAERFGASTRSLKDGGAG